MRTDEEILAETTFFLESLGIKNPKDEETLLRELDDVEMEAIEDVLDDMKGEDLAFNNLFNGEMRKVINFPTMDNESELGRFVEMLKQVLGLTIDWEKGMVSAQREWTEASIENDAAYVDFIAMGGEGPKKVNRKFQMKIGKYFAKVDKLLQDYRILRRKIAHEVWKGRQDNSWTASFSVGQIKDSLSTDELKRLYQIQNGLELYVGTDSIASLSKHYEGYEIAQTGKITKMPDLAKYWQENAGYIKKNIGELTNDKYSIIITRHPIDVMRMSDFNRITSCHSPPSRSGGTNEYYKCAVAEARGHGAIAYVVETEDLLYMTNTSNIESAEQEIQEGEIFGDEIRGSHIGIGDSKRTLQPKSRTRLRQMRYYDTDTPKRWDDGTELAVPEERIYGASIPGLADRIREWARKNQEEALRNMPSTNDDKEDVNLNRFYIFGGSYEDTAGAEGRKTLLSRLAMIETEAMTGKIRQNKETEDALDANAISGLLGRYTASVEEIEVSWNQHYAAVGVNANVQDDGDGGVYIEADARITFEYDIDEFSSLPNSYPTGMYAFDNINDIWGDIFDSSSGFVNKFSNTAVHIGCRFNLEHPDIGESALMYDPDGFNDFCQVLDRLDDRRDGFKATIDEFLKREGYLEGGEYLKLAYEIEDAPFESYEWDVRSDGEDPSESYTSTAAVSHDFNPEELGVDPRVLFNILDSRDWRLFIRKELLKQARDELGVEYYLDIENSQAVVPPTGQDIKYTLTFKITADDPDARVQLFRELTTGAMDDEDVLNNLFDWAMKQTLNARLPASQQQNLDEHLVKTWKGFLGR
tara:strand:+ start:16041 stop:18476 length:2436 start_codon:yes stop_codon:yes gene_type:complete